MNLLPLIGERFALLLQRHPLVFFHLITAFAALILGSALLLRRKGSTSHRWLGWLWVVLMGSTALATAFIRDYRLPNLAGFTPIHVFTLLVAVGLPRAIWFVKRGNIAGHRKQMKSIFVGGSVLAGIFTLLPGRFLGNLLWQHALGVLA